jgi:DNA-binding transcriptional LysR family regulator
MVSLRELRTFVRVVERKSFTQAGQDLHLTQPAVSFQIRSLEEAYGVELLDRSGQEIIPTASGEVLLTYAQKILELQQESRKAIDELNQLVRGTLEIGASTGPGEHILPQLLGRFKAQYPQIQVLLRLSRTEEIIEEVRERILEIGIVGARSEVSNLVFQPFVKDELVVIAGPQHHWTDAPSVNLDDLIKEPFILQQPGAGIRTMLEEGLQDIGLDLRDLNVYMELGLQESVKTAVAEGLGVGIISRFAVRQELESGALAEIAVQDLPAFREDFYLVRNRKKKLSRLTATFLSYAMSNLQSIVEAPSAQPDC